MKHLILSLSLLLGLATSVSANDKPIEAGDVFFCQMEEFTQWDVKERKLKNYKLEKFKFSIVDPDTVKFGNQGYLGGTILKIAHFSKGYPFLTASDTLSLMNIKDGNFTFVLSTSAVATLIAATCDRF